jgi:hypothetical protein
MDGQQTSNLSCGGSSPSRRATLQHGVAMTREEMIKALLTEVNNWDIEDLKWFAESQMRMSFEKDSDEKITRTYNMVILGK